MPLTREALLDNLTDPLLTVREAALVLNVCKDTVRRWNNRGLLLATRTPAGQRRFRLSAIVTLMEKRGATPTAA